MSTKCHPSAQRECYLSPRSLSLRCWPTGCILVRAILLPAPRHSKSSRGTPRLRHHPGTLHGALRLAAQATALVLDLDSFRLGARPGLDDSISSRHPSVVQAVLKRAATCSRRLWLFGFSSFLGASGEATAPSWVGGLAVSWLFSSRRQAHFLLEPPLDPVLMPNVRAKRAPTAGRQARAGENVPRTTGPGLVACRWRSA